MRFRPWFGLAVLAVVVNAAVLACALNPQPLPPIDSDGGADNEETPSPNASLGADAGTTPTDADAAADGDASADAPADAPDAG